jgi:hypothetical protein
MLNLIKNSEVMVKVRQQCEVVDVGSDEINDKGENV